MSGELAGTLREHVVIETRLGNRNSAAGAIGNYAYAGEAWASLNPIMPATLAEASALSALPRWQITMRKRDGIDMKTRLTWRRKYLAVRSVISDPKEPAYMLLTCEEVR